jgi:molybdate transport system substrate-binding protein
MTRYVAALPLQSAWQSKPAIVGALLACSLWALTAVACWAEIKVMGDSPLEPALAKVADLYRQQTHNEVRFMFAPSPVLKNRIDAGVRADVVIVQPDFVDQLAKSGKVTAGDRPIIGRVGVGLANRKDSPAYDISTPEKLKNTLLGADMLVFNNVKSGQAFEKVLERLGLAEALEPKIVRTSPLGVFEPVLKGKGNDMAAGTIPLIETTPGIKLLGPLPGDFQHYLTYSAALMTNTAQPDAAEGFIKFLVSPEAKSTLAANGIN